jgi:K+-transporting ATPase KdpF subunit
LNAPARRAIRGWAGSDGTDDRSYVRGSGIGSIYRKLGIRSTLRTTIAENNMNLLYIIAGTTALALLVYLFLALLKPEWFG